MRVLHFIPDIGIANGVMSVVLNYAAAMPEDIKFDVVYFQETEKTKQKQIEALGGEVFKVNSPLSKKSFVLSFAKLLKENKGRWEAVHIHVPYYSCLIAPLTRLYGIKKVFAHCHSTTFSLLGKLTPVFKLMNIPTRWMVNKCFACSYEAGIVWYKKERSFEVINNAIDCEKFIYNDKTRLDTRKALNVEGKTVVTHLGTGLLPQKNHTFLFEIFREYLKLDNNAVLLLIGAEKDNNLSSLCQKNGIIDKVLFLGLRNDVSELLQATDVFIFPSIKEGLPVAVIEAQAAGLPVLMSDSVTSECIITELVKALPLKACAAVWANECKSALSLPRNDTSDILKRAGWDIHTAANHLAKYYYD